MGDAFAQNKAIAVALEATEGATSYTQFDVNRA